MFQRAQCFVSLKETPDGWSSQDTIKTERMVYDQNLCFFVARNKVRTHLKTFATIFAFKK